MCEMRTLLDAQAAALIEAEQRLLEELDELVDALEGDAGLRKVLRQALRDLTDLFLLVVVGEFNAGKSAVINALLGAAVLEEGVTPTTAQIHIIRYGPKAERVETPDGVVVITYPTEWLRHMALVDTPGTNAIVRRHQEITEEFIPRSDLVLFVTSADRPFTESERAFLERVRQWGKKIVFVVNKADLLDEAELNEVVHYVTENARRTLGISPVVFAVSARLAQQASQAAGERRAALWTQSRFAALEAFIRETLDQRERLRLKLSGPLGIARRVLAELHALADERRQVLRADVEGLEAIEAQLAAYEEEMRQELTYRLSHVDNTLQEMATRGHRFFNETIRLGRLFDLLNKDKLKREFEREVISDAPALVEHQVSEIIDWLVDQEHRQWRAMNAILQERANALSKAGQLHDHPKFGAARQRLLQSAGRAAREVVASYNREAEVQALVETVQTTLAQTALVEAGAVGVGALLVALLHGVLLDVTGIIGAGLVAAAGLYLLPARREKARREFMSRIERLRRELRDVLGQTFAAEIARSVQGMRDALAPYARFVRGEQSRLENIVQRLEAAEGRLADLERQVQQLD